MLEVGPGLGVLTRYLADRVSHVHAVEVDRSLEPALAEDAGRRHERRAALGRRPPARPRRPRAGTAKARREPPLQHRDAADRRDARRAAPARAVVRDGAARGRRPLVRGAVDQGLRRRLRARPADRAPYGVPSGVTTRVPAAAERVDSALVAFESVPPPPRLADVRAVVEAASRTAARRSPNALALAGLAERDHAVAALGLIGRPAAIRAEALAPEEFVALDAALRS